MSKGKTTKSGDTEPWIGRLAKLLASGQLLLDQESLKKHSTDKWFAAAMPEAVALPKTAESVARILRFCSKEKIPVTPRGAGQGYVGGCVPVQKGVVLCLD